MVKSIAIEMMNRIIAFYKSKASHNLCKELEIRLGSIVKS